MSATPLHDIWEASVNQPFRPAVGKPAQFAVGFTLLLVALILSGLFGLNNSLKNLPVYGIPASLAFGFGAVFMICAVGSKEMPPQQRILFSAVSSSARQLLTLLRCLPPSSKAHIQLSAEGLRISTEDGSAMEAFVFVEKTLFTAYRYDGPMPPEDENEPDNSPIFQVNLDALLETLNIFTIADMPAPKQSATTEAYAAHRLNRHAGINALTAFGLSGVCTLTYQEEGSPLSIHMSDAGVATTCDLTTYVVSVPEEIPFDRESIATKTIMRSSALLDAMTELAALTPTTVKIAVRPADSNPARITFSSQGTLGSAMVHFVSDATAGDPILETLQCPEKLAITYSFALIRSAQRAMQTAHKVSLRIDDSGVLSMQFLLEIEGQNADRSTAFVDFRVVPMVDDDDDASSDSGEDASP